MQVVILCGGLGTRLREETEFHPKPMVPIGGFFVFNKAIGQHLEGDACVLEQKPMEQIARTQQLKAYCHDGFWQCMDTYREQELFNQMWQADKAPWKVW